MTKAILKATDYQPQIFHEVNRADFNANNTRESVSVEELLKFVEVWARSISRKSTQTVTTYGKSIKVFFNYLADNRINTVSSEVVENYREDLIEKIKINRLSAYTARLYLVVLKTFVKWAARQKNSNFDNFTADVESIEVNTTKHARNALTVEEIKKLLASYDEKPKSEKNLRDKAIISILATCGLRACEISRLTIRDIEVAGKHFLKVLGKGRQSKERVPLPVQVEKLIFDYLRQRGLDVAKIEDAIKHGGFHIVKENKARVKVYEPLMDLPLFASTSRSNKGAALDVQNVSKMVKALIREVLGDEKDCSSYSCHSLRHSAATNALLAGVDIEKVRLTLRHKSVVTTQIYRHDITAMNNDASAVNATEIFNRSDSNAKN